MLLNNLKNKVVTIWGMGTEGTAVKAYLEKHRIPKQILVYNDADGEEVFQAILDKTDVIIRYPGVSIYKPELARTRDEGIKITSSSDLFLNEMRANHP